MTKIFIIHGTEGSPEVNWFPWLKQELEKLGHTVFVPEFPTPENQSLDNWLKFFGGYEKEINRDSIIVGHSLGPAFILNFLERTNRKIKACFLVAGFTGLLGNEHFDNLNRTFTDKQFNWNKIKENCEKFYVINSENDPYVPLEKGKELADKLEVELTILSEAGHINSEAGFIKFEKLLNMIKEELK